MVSSAIVKNLQIQNNVIHQAYVNGVTKLLFLGSTCIYHRNEHWIVVSGTATVTVGSDTRLIRPNESTYIKMGELHRLSNEGKISVVLIEAQVGEYTGEDDIVRIEDDFKRD